jgi:hypothetical protein
LQLKTARIIEYTHIALEFPCSHSQELLHARRKSSIRRLQAMLDFSYLVLVLRENNASCIRKSSHTHGFPSLPILVLSRTRNGWSSLQVFLSIWVDVDLRASVKRSPLRLLLEKPHRLNILQSISHSVSKPQVMTLQLTFLLSVVKR